MMRRLFLGVNHDARLAADQDREGGVSLPTDLSRLSDVRLAALDRACDRLLKKEIERVSAKDVRFARVLREALIVEDEVNRRQSL